MIVPNYNKVPKGQWKKWSPSAQRVFNHLFDMMTENQNLFRHPKGPLVDMKHFRTTAWNAAWEAAYAVDNT